MSTEKKNLVTNLQRFSLQDGPGIRTSIFLKGCPLRCEWCHNPECIGYHNEIFHDIEKCVRCGECARICPEGAISSPKTTGNDETSTPSFKTCCTAQNQDIRENNNSGMTIDPPRIDRDKCTMCNQCVNACNYNALTMAGTLMSADEILDKVKSDKVFYDTSGGGATISGGEPLSHPQTTLLLLKLFKENGISTAIDTSGYADWNILETLLEYTDIVLLDIKTLDEEKHKKWTGVSNAIIIENAKRMALKKIKMRLRLPIIHDVNFWDLNHPRSVVDFAKELGKSISGIDILPYHDLGESKYVKLGRKNFFSGFPSLLEEDVEDYASILRHGGPWEVTIGGMIGCKQETEQ